MRRTPAIIILVVLLIGFVLVALSNQTVGYEAKESTHLPVEVISNVEGSVVDSSDLNMAIVKAGELNRLRLLWKELKGDTDDVVLIAPVSDEESDRYFTSQSNALKVAESITGKSLNMSANNTNIEGGSAGLMFSLAFIDAASEGSLSGGKKISGTGSVDEFGTVGKVGQTKIKIEGAVAQQVEVFFVAKSEEQDAKKAAGDRLTVVSVNTVAEALAWLCANGGTSSYCAQRKPPGFHLRAFALLIRLLALSQLLIEPDLHAGQR